ncbi:MAG: PIN domain-containing protein [Dermatophilaceae bacterium]|nr:PIN domain-containing protein [Dermatophilaceae bacterium]
MRGSGPADVFVDSYVLYSRTLLDWLGLLYVEPLVEPPFAVYWSDDVMVEVMHHLRKNNPTWPGGQIARFRERLESTFEVGRVRDYAIDGTYSGPDPDDAHVHAAATACRADYLLTCNVKHFDTKADDLVYEVIAPDQFFLLVDDVAPALVAAVVGRQIDYWMSRASEIDLGAQLERAGCPAFAQRIRAHLRRRAMAGA